MTALYNTHPFVRKIFLVLTLSLASALLYGQKQGGEQVSGNVITSDGKPAEYVNVALKGTFYGGSTDVSGKFSFRAPAGKYTMVVSAITAHSKEMPVEVKAGGGNTFADITIMEDAKSLDQVVVTGQFSPQSLRNSLYKVRVVGQEQIDQKAAQSIESLLNTEIGVRLSNDMALGETDFELMGMSGNNVKVLIDGVPVIDRGANKQSLSQIDINTVERVEIVEGPMSVVYGTDALAGVINIITKKPRKEQSKDIWTVSGGLHEESVGSEYKPFAGKGIHNENIQLGWSGKWGVYANGGFTRHETGGWKGDKTGRELLWQPKEQYIYNATAGYAKKGFNAWYRLDYLDETIKTPLNGSDIHPEEVSDRNYETDRQNHQLQVDWKASNRFSLNAAASYQDYKRRTRTIITDTDTGEKWLSLEESAQDLSTVKSAFARATATWAITTKLTLQPGVEYKWDKVAGGRIHGEPEISDLAAYVSAEWRPASWVNLRPGVRSILNSGYDAPFAIPTMLTKFTLRHNMDLRLSYAYGFRAPTLRELYFSFHNANHNIDGNPDLKAEYSNNYSASFTWRILHGGAVRLTSTLTGFWNDFRDRITTATDVNDPLHTTYYNIDRYKTTGGTLENTVAWKNLTASVSGSLIGRYNRLADNETFAAQNLPQFRFSPEASASITYKIEKSGTGFNLFYKFTGSRQEYSYSTGDAQATLRGMNSFQWADLTITQRVWKNKVAVNAGVKNIFDVTTVDNSSGGGMGSTSNASLVGCGRSFFVGLTFNFSNN